MRTTAVTKWTSIALNYETLDILSRLKSSNYDNLWTVAAFESNLYGPTFETYVLFLLEV